MRTLDEGDKVFGSYGYSMVKIDANSGKKFYAFADQNEAEKWDDAEVVEVGTDDAIDYLS